ncbi:condensation domain-containing protein [Aneurinibacillus aneurinilyticus]|uniref:Condensation domain protein n=1 Tax=Aneurinibacillus aneurinilyticus ATCC 12856 TaxID=649747 RepID=U1Y0F2_ANEAE|nr:condensation domain-containing protein [Aneurinibacillus aneurinilyticus]ERI05707.1 condensation domain protein [Aneurinibacillus aneurinilyticus ATCC 12856]MED0708908.1 condensation domain-containing protein [Aneurinibacillus aneurinilyticus]MED0722919.1 condensation domain-containing protein [Aneurinibacillus aneurinilyticus]MED0732581.1 condensation domain-containing protein [Aneurinibacillus aneurinilyticus]MED0740693.1 condensation domain-containing protein [Aneurinibacillus aneurinily
MSNILDIYPLSPLQEGMLFHALYDEEAESCSYIVQISFLLRGYLDIPTFERSWEYVINRHEILRAAFIWEEIENPLQVVYDHTLFKINELDWSCMSSEEREEQVRLFLESDRKQRFQLDEAPLMRVAVMKEADKEYRVVWTHHHILLDGWSVSLLLNELFTVYVKMAGGEALDFPKPPPYKKYIEWIKRQDKNKAEQFWRKELKGFTAPTQLFLERKDRGKEKGYGESVCHLSEEKTQQLQTWVRNHQLTLNTLLQGAWAYLLSRYSGENDIIFGVTSSGRPAELVGVEGIIGPFINTLPARIGVADDLDIVDWLLEIQRNEIERRQYEYSSLTEIQGWSEVPREVPLFHTLYVFENYPTEKDNVNSELEITQVQSVEQTNYPLNLVVIPGKQLSLKLMYDRSRFEETAMNRIQGHLLQVLNQMTE